MTQHKNFSAGSPRSRCFANLHLTMEEYALWDVLRSLSHSTGTVYFDGETVATYFARTGKNTIYRIVKSLVKKGWLFVQTKGRNTRNGLYMATQYQVLSHEEWAEANPGECIVTEPRDSIPESGNGSVPEPEIDDEPVPEPGTVHSQNREQPIPESVTAIPETRNGPFPESVTTIPGTGKYIVKEIPLFPSSDFPNAASRPADPSILQREARQRIENLDGWLAGRISATLQKKLETVIVPTKQERHKLSALAAGEDNGHLDVLLGFYHFADRDRKLYGLDYPISLFISQADQWIDLAGQKQESHDNDAIETVSRMLDDFGVPESVADEIYEPLCELAYLECELNDEKYYNFEIVDEYLSVRYGPVQVERAAEVAA